jgi:Fe2+ or Zn2+ uptake regulation protein
MTKLQRTIDGRGHTTLMCAACGKIFTRPNAHIRGITHACSKQCSHKLKAHKPKTLLECTCKECGKQFQIRKGRGGTGEYCSVACAAAQRGKNMRGPNHPKWNNGSSERSYASRKTIAQVVAERGRCEECGVIEDLQGHHAKSHSSTPALRADPNNIQVLCKICHAGKHPRLAKFILAGGKHA